MYIYPYSEVSLVQSSYGKGGRGMRSLRSSNFSNSRTSWDWIQLEPLIHLINNVDLPIGNKNIHDTVNV